MTHFGWSTAPLPPQHRQRCVPAVCHRLSGHSAALWQPDWQGGVCACPVVCVCADIGLTQLFQHHSMHWQIFIKKCQWVHLLNILPIRRFFTLHMFFNYLLLILVQVKRLYFDFVLYNWLCQKCCVIVCSSLRQRTFSVLVGSDGRLHVTVSCLRWLEANLPG